MSLLVYNKINDLSLALFDVPLPYIRLFPQRAFLVGEGMSLKINLIEMTSLKLFAKYKSIILMSTCAIIKRKLYN